MRGRGSAEAAALTADGGGLVVDGEVYCARDFVFLRPGVGDVKKAVGRAGSHLLIGHLMQWGTNLDVDNEKASFPRPASLRSLPRRLYMCVRLAAMEERKKESVLRRSSEVTKPAKVSGEAHTALASLTYGM